MSALRHRVRSLRQLCTRAMPRLRRRVLHAAERRAQAAFALLVAACVLPFVGGLFAGLTSLPKGAGGDIAFGMLLNLVKVACWLLGIPLLIPVGLTDLVVNLCLACPPGEQSPSDPGPPLGGTHV